MQAVTFYLCDNIEHLPTDIMTRLIGIARMECRFSSSPLCHIVHKTVGQASSLTNLRSSFFLNIRTDTTTHIRKSTPRYAPL